MRIGYVLCAFTTALVQWPAVGIEISTASQTYLIGQPVCLRISDTHAHVPLALEAGEYVLRIHRPDGAEATYSPPVMLCMCGKEGEPFPSVEHAVLIGRKGGLLFEVPGEYGLTLCRKADGTVVSNRCLVRMAEPTAPADRVALTRIRSAAASYATVIYLEGGEHFGKGFAVVEALAATPSAYQHYARFVMSRSFSQVAVDPKTGTARAPDLAKAVEYSECLNGTVDPYVRLRNAYALQALLEKAERKGVLSSLTGTQGYSVARTHISSVRGDLKDERSYEAKAILESPW